MPPHAVCFALPCPAIPINIMKLHCQSGAIKIMSAATDGFSKKSDRQVQPGQTDSSLHKNMPDTI